LNIMMFKVNEYILRIAMGKRALFLNIFSISN